MTDEAMEVNALYAAIIDWAMNSGAKNIASTPGLWHRKTEKVGGLGPIDVRINPHDETVDHVPPFAIKLSMDDYFPGLIGIESRVYDDDGDIARRALEAAGIKTEADR
mgnify:CR=1 FL=1